MKNFLNLVWKNALAYVLSYLTITLLFWLYVLLFVKHSASGWSILMSMLRNGVSSLLLSITLTILLFNLIVLNAKRLFNSRMSVIMLGGILGGLCFVGLMLFTYYLIWFITYPMLMVAGGGLFGYFYYQLVVSRRKLET